MIHTLYLRMRQRRRLTTGSKLIALKQMGSDPIGKIDSRQRGLTP